MLCLPISQVYSDFDPENREHEITDIVGLISVYKYEPVTIDALIASQPYLSTCTIIVIRLAGSTFVLLAV